MFVIANIAVKNLLQQKAALNGFVQINVLIFGKLLVLNMIYITMLTMMLNVIIVERFFIVQFIKIFKNIIFVVKTVVKIGMHRLDHNNQK